MKLQDKGSTKEALLILTEIYDKQEPASHGYAMMAMGLARAYRLIGNYALEEKFLMLAAMTDTKLAVKENEALLTLAVNLYHKGDIDRAYNYIKVALDDAIFYNSRFKMPFSPGYNFCLFICKIQGDRRATTNKLVRNI